MPPTARSALRGLILILAAVTAPLAQPMERVYYDGLADDGTLTGGRLLLPRPTLAADQAPASREFVTIVDNGPPANRVDLVCVGDGYTAGQLDLYATHVENAVAGLLAAEPFQSYASLFNVHRVDVVSNESGVDNDPVLGIERDTALDMAFWCENIERLLCVDVEKATMHALAAPDIDQIFAVANSIMYGGAGYTDSDLATYSGGNGAAAELALHELGHSHGDLADEYDYSNGNVYTGPEPEEPNVSIYDAAGMADLNTKWAGWLGHTDDEFNGLVYTYEGAYYHEFGVYRPTATSRMRSLGRPFNLPSVESLILEIYRIVDPIDDCSPSGTVLEGWETVWVDPADPASHALSIQWAVDGVPLVGAVGDSLDLSAYDFTAGLHSLSVTVVDPTPLVRDEAARAELMTQTVSWQLQIAEPTGVTADSAPGPTLRLDIVPNPFGPQTTVYFALVSPGMLRLQVFDVAGRLVRTLVNEQSFPAGAHGVLWDGKTERGATAPAGIYLCRLQVDGRSISRHITHVR